MQVDNGERIVDIVRAYGSGDTLIVVIPKPARQFLGVKRGTKFEVKIDQKNRLIFETVSLTVD